MTHDPLLLTLGLVVIFVVAAVIISAMDSGSLTVPSMMAALVVCVVIVNKAAVSIATPQASVSLTSNGPVQQRKLLLKGRRRPRG